MSKNKTSFYYSLKNEFLKRIHVNPCSGVRITEYLKWHTHTTAIAKKANTTLSFLRQNLHHCPQNNERTIRITLVRSALEYEVIIQDPYHHKDVEKLECILHCASCFITRDSRMKELGCISAMLQQLNCQAFKTDAVTSD